jgi:molybdate transport system regulatory protein
MSDPGVDGRFWLNVEGESFAGTGRIALLEGIEQTGSISAAARAMGMSYKAAWDAVDAMNNLSPEPLLTRRAGGPGGGGTALTDYGRRVIRHYRQVERLYRRFLRQLTESAGEIDDIHSVMRNLSMRTSARNHLVGTVSELREGAVNDEAVIDVGAGLSLRAAVTRQSSRELALARPGREVHVFIKAPFVMLADGDAGRHSAANRIAGTVRAVDEGAVQTEVRVEIGEGRTLTAMVSREAAAEDWLRPGAEVVALVSAAHIILAVSDGPPAREIDR